VIAGRPRQVRKLRLEGHLLEQPPEPWGYDAAVDVSGARRELESVVDVVYHVPVALCLEPHQHDAHVFGES